MGNGGGQDKKIDSKKSLSTLLGEQMMRVSNICKVKRS